MKFVFELNSNDRFSIRRAIEDELIRVKGRVEMNRQNYNMEPSSYELDSIERLERILTQVVKSPDVAIYENGDRSVLPTLT